MVKIILSGANGKMGQVIARCVEQRADCNIVAGVDLHTSPYSNFPIYSTCSDIPADADVLIDFSHPTMLQDLLAFAEPRSLPVVLATTGYSEEQIDFLKQKSALLPIFFSFNMSLGVHLLVSLAKKAALVLGEQFDIEVIEKHHNQKIDAPSGTALMIADGINDALGNTKIYQYDRHAQRKNRQPHEIGLHAIRGGTIVGEHEVIFAGHDEVVTISHQAASKEIFAVGAINAALFMVDKPAGLYDMSALAEVDH